MYISLARSFQNGSIFYYYSKHPHIRTLRRLRTSAERWPPFLNKNQLSWINISYKQEKDARIKPRPNAKCQRNISHCWPGAFSRPVAPCCDMPSVDGSSLNMVQFEPTTSNISGNTAQQDG